MESLEQGSKPWKKKDWKMQRRSKKKKKKKKKKKIILLRTIWVK